MEDLTASHAKVKEKQDSLQAALTSSEELLQSLLTGLSSNNGANAGGGGYMGQLSDARTRAAQAAAEEEQCRVKDRKSTRLNSSHSGESRMPSSA